MENNLFDLTFGNNITGGDGVIVGEIIYTPVYNHVTIVWRDNTNTPQYITSNYKTGIEVFEKCMKYVEKVIYANLNIKSFFTMTTHNNRVVMILNKIYESGNTRRRHNPFGEILLRTMNVPFSMKMRMNLEYYNMFLNNAEEEPKTTFDNQEFTGGTGNLPYNYKEFADGVEYFEGGPLEISKNSFAHLPEGDVAMEGNGDIDTPLMDRNVDTSNVLNNVLQDEPELETSGDSESESDSEMELQRGTIRLRRESDLIMGNANRGREVILGGGGVRPVDKGTNDGFLNDSGESDIDKGIGRKAAWRIEKRKKHVQESSNGSDGSPAKKKPGIEEEMVVDDDKDFMNKTPTTFDMDSYSSDEVYSQVAKPEKRDTSLISRVKRPIQRLISGGVKLAGLAGVKRRSQFEADIEANGAPSDKRKNVVGTFMPRPKYAESEGGNSLGSLVTRMNRMDITEFTLFILSDIHRKDVAKFMSMYESLQKKTPFNEEFILKFIASKTSTRLQEKKWLAKQRREATAGMMEAIVNLFVYYKPIVGQSGTTKEEMVQ